MLKGFKSFTSGLAQNLLATVIVALIPVTFLVSFLTGTVDILLRFINSAVPVWALIICLLVIALYMRRIVKRGSKPDQETSKKFLIEDSGLKWRVVDHKNGHCSVDQIPLCVVHGYEYIKTNGDQYICREMIGSKCDAKIVDADDLTLLWNMAKSKAQSMIVQYETKR